MHCFVFAIFCLAVSAAMPANSNTHLYLLPISREQLQAKLDASNSGVRGSYKGVLFENDRNRFDGTATVGKTSESKGLIPDQFGARVDYTDKQSGLSAFGGAENTRGFGTDVNAGLKYNIQQGANFGVDLTGQYDRHFGGHGGTGPSDTGVFLNAHANF